ncbi:hypothetical protein CspHIS471_0212780 [Cutaneotrichosporon sp. HIS471]|nr:hypothetical protein CspHIS471_0212780 [Cutaneotrichosporon sp. HIS471]
MPTVLVHIPHSEGGAHGDDEPLPASRFAEPSSNPDDPDLATVVRRIRSAKRIVVVCGAGVSTAASIPDFRSSTGLFARGCVKDLFHIKSLTSPHLLPSHHALLSNLNRLADQAEPTAFHLFLRDMDREGRPQDRYTCPEATGFLSLIFATTAIELVVPNPTVSVINS